MLMKKILILALFILSITFVFSQGTYRSNKGTIGLDRMELPPETWNTSSYCQSMKDDISGVNANSLLYWFNTYDYFTYIMIDGGSFCEGHCLDSEHGNPFISGEATLGDCLSQPFGTSSAVVSTSSSNKIECIEINVDEDDPYTVIFQICSDCNDCIDDVPNSIFWWEGEKDYEAGQIPTAQDPSEFYYAFYIDYFVCTETLNCGNWPGE